MAEWAIGQGWLKVTKSTSINDYNHKLKENNKGVKQQMMKCHLKKVFRRHSC